MRIAQVSPLIESVPPRQYGGTERIVSYLTEELIRQGHDVTLFASGDSITHAHLEAIIPKALRLENRTDPLASHLLMLEKVYLQSRRFDIIHFHTGYIHFPICRRLQVPTITTHHGRLDFSEWQPLYREFGDLPVISISNHQRLPISWANWQATVYNGVPQEFYTYRDQPGSYLAFLGRISPEKRVDRAIEIARRVGIKLKIAAKIDKVDMEYYETTIKPLLNGNDVEFIGEICEAEKDEFLGNAYALLFPIDWPEPFGLVMIESMACGTPVIAYRNGSVPEVMQDGVTGFIVNNQDEAVAAVNKLDQIDRAQCRRVFEQSFSSARMARDYTTVYKQLIYKYHRPRLVG
jgi:glycosyltransferase involved in cell wall biosynthesis